MRTLLLSSLLLAFVTHAEEPFTQLFNGKDLTGWEGDPQLWKVEEGCIVGTCTGPEAMKDNSFLIWRGGRVKDFELRAKVRLTGDNNSGLQYRSREVPEVAPWVITGYQCDIHPALEHTGMTYEERGRRIFGLNGQNVLIAPSGALWLMSEHQPVKVDIAQWNEWTVLAQGNHLIHQVNGQLTSHLTDCDDTHRALEGLLAIQLHRGNANVVQVKDIRLRVLPEAKVVAYDEAAILASGAKKMEPAKSTRPQGVGEVKKAK